MKIYLVRSTWTEDGKAFSVINAEEDQSAAMEYMQDELSIEGTNAQMKVVEVEFD